jgi:hypothetical protein
MIRCTYANEVWYSKTLRTYLQVLIELLFYLTKLLNMAAVRSI